MPDPDRQYYSSQPVENNIKAGSHEALVSMHLAMFSNTRHIMEGEVVVDTVQQIEWLHKIRMMLYWNTNQIDTVNEGLSDGTCYYDTFSSRQHGRDRLRILHHQRERIKRMWNGQIERMKYV